MQAFVLNLVLGMVLGMAAAWLLYRVHGRLPLDVLREGLRRWRARQRVDRKTEARRRMRP